MEIDLHVKTASNPRSLEWFGVTILFETELSIIDYQMP
jgi:hypothetical protein